MVYKKRDFHLLCFLRLHRWEQRMEFPTIKSFVCTRCWKSKIEISDIYTNAINSYHKKMNG